MLRKPHFDCRRSCRPSGRPADRPGSSAQPKPTARAHPTQENARPADQNARFANESFGKPFFSEALMEFSLNAKVLLCQTHRRRAPRTPVEAVDSGGSTGPSGVLCPQPVWPSHAFVSFRSLAKPAASAAFCASSAGCAGSRLDHHLVHPHQRCGDSGSPFA